MVAKDCGPLAVPTNGSFLGSQTSFPNRFIFSCDEGFILKGSKDRKCQSNGTWSGSESLCAGSCGVMSSASIRSRGSSRRLPNLLM